MNYERLKELIMIGVDEKTLLEMADYVNSYNGALDHLRVSYNDEEFFSLYFENKPYEAVRSVLYGDYRINDEYVRFNGYENLVSLDEYDLFRELRENKEDIIDEYLSLVENNSIDSDCISDFISELEEEEEQEEGEE